MLTHNYFSEDEAVKEAALSKAESEEEEPANTIAVAVSWFPPCTVEDRGTLFQFTASVETSIILGSSEDSAFKLDEFVAEGECELFDAGAMTRSSTGRNNSFKK